MVSRFFLLFLRLFEAWVVFTFLLSSFVGFWPCSGTYFMTSSYPLRFKRLLKYWEELLKISALDEFDDMRFDIEWGICLVIVGG